MRMEWGQMELEGGLCRVRAGRMWKDLVEEKMMGDCGKGTRIIYLLCCSGQTFCVLFSVVD